MVTNNAEILLSKTAIAQRQLDAAIRMYFSGEDTLAVYTVASAAHRILRDLMEKRGRSSAAEALQAGVRGVANELASGDLPDEIRKASEGQAIWEVVTKLADIIRNGGSNTQLRVTAGRGFDGAYWKSQNHSANFLKHADIDADSAISTDKIATEPLIDGACMTYMQLMVEPTVEMEAYALLRLIELKTNMLPESIEWIPSALAQLPPERRGEACFWLARELRRCRNAPPIPRSS